MPIILGGLNKDVGLRNSNDHLESWKQLIIIIVTVKKESKIETDFSKKEGRKEII